MIGFGKYGKMVRESSVARSITRGNVKSNMTKGFATLGSRGHMRNMNQASKIASGKRRAVGIGGALALNAQIGPSGNRSTARNGVRPRSTGGYA